MAGCRGAAAYLGTILKHVNSMTDKKVECQKSSDLPSSSQSTAITLGGPV